MAVLYPIIINAITGQVYISMEPTLANSISVKNKFITKLAVTIKSSKACAQKI